MEEISIFVENLHFVVFLFLNSISASLHLQCKKETHHDSSTSEKDFFWLYFYSILDQKTHNFSFLPVFVFVLCVLRFVFGFIAPS